MSVTVQIHLEHDTDRVGGVELPIGGWFWHWVICIGGFIITVYIIFFP